MTMIDVPAFLKKRAHGRSRKPQGATVKIKTNGEPLSEIIRRSIEPNRTIEDSAKSLQMNRDSYARARDVVLLSQRIDLNADDARLVAKAIALMDERLQPRVSYEIVKPLVRRLWGTRGRRNRSDSAKQNRFFASISFLLTACATSAEIPIPYLGPKDRDRASRELGEAQAALSLLQQRIHKQEDAT
jgi:hypothetical protein